MIRDEVIEEVWRAKDKLAKQYHHDVEAMAKALRANEKKAKVKVVDRSAKRRRQSPRRRSA